MYMYLIGEYYFRWIEIMMQRKNAPGKKVAC